MERRAAPPSPPAPAWPEPMLMLEDRGPDRDAGESLYPLLPLRHNVVFPRLMEPLIVGRDRSLLAVEAALLGDQRLVVVAQRDPNETDPGAEDLYRIGTEVRLARVLRMPDGSTSILVQGRQRVRILEVVDEDDHLSAAVVPLWEQAQTTQPSEGLMRAVLGLFERCVALSPRLSDEAYVAALNATEPGWLADVIAASLLQDVSAKQEVLEILDPVQRLQHVSVLLGKELDLLELEGHIQSQVQQQVQKSQREFFLREQLRVIQAELGEVDERTREIAELQARIERANMPSKAREKAEHELRRLAAMPPASPEIASVRSYLDWLIELPWSRATEDNMDIAHAAAVLARNHYGLAKAKDRILEHIAVRKLARDKMSTPILCLVGPPGTGKTSMGRSVAEALGRRFVRISLGGVRDEAEIRGHRRTYVGALPGRILQAMRTAGTVNPVFMIDEIDKLGLDFRGDPAAALLEVLDPEQNREFIDHYLDVPYDLSQVFFIATANFLDPIPEPLLDRLEIIDFPGYIEEEKLRIARQFLIPRQVEQTGLTAHGLTFTDPALRRIVREYTSEAGLRNLERAIAAVCRKVARRVAEGKAAPHRITPSLVARYLGPPEFASTAAEERDEVGVATGVAWTEAGGDLVQVEVTLMPGKGNLLLTGQMGEVMQESAQAALSYARSHAAELGIEEVNFDELDVHVHLPEGAIPKDGPSAGITMATALVSALTNRPVRRDVAMTGEITLRGRVLPVGGLKEKAIAAHRAGIKTLLVPQKNAKDLVELPPRIRREVQVVLVSHMSQVLEQTLLPPVEGARPVAPKGGSRKRSNPRKAGPPYGRIVRCHG
ncbi:MAG: endopeptidase La [Caldilineales bacterium]|nr:endopeptidase La [Caldilineales bacterium]MDW8316654.1 endopeptidase La [Anaerolineae bacterium]